jgi:hypothetical protein
MAMESKWPIKTKSLEMGQKPKFHEVANFQKSQIKTRKANCVMSLAHANTHGFLALPTKARILCLDSL